MRHVAAVQVPSFTREGRVNQKVPSWTPVATIRGLLRPLSGREAVNAQQVKAEVTCVFETRWPGASLAIDPSMQLVVEGRKLRIAAVIDVNFRHKELHIFCTEVAIPT